MRTCKQIFEEELSGESLHQNSIIKGMIISQIEVLEEVNKSYPEILPYRINDKIQELKRYLDDKES